MSTFSTHDRNNSAALQGLPSTSRSHMNHRDASNNVESKKRGREEVRGTWNEAPTPIRMPRDTGPSTSANHGNRWTTSAMNSTLHQQRTVLGTNKVGRSDTPPTILAGDAPYNPVNKKRKLDVAHSSSGLTSQNRSVSSKFGFDLGSTAALRGAGYGRDAEIVEIERPVALSNRKVLATRSNGKGQGISASTLSSSRAPPVHLEVDDDDVGEVVLRSDYLEFGRGDGPEPISDDPLNIRSASATSLTGRLAESPHPFDSVSVQRQSTKDGASTRRLQKKIAEAAGRDIPEVIVLENDPIEDADGFGARAASSSKRKTSPLGKTVMPADNVQKKIVVFEKKNPVHIGKINLAALPKKGLGKLVGSMKGKQQSKLDFTLEPRSTSNKAMSEDKIATSTSGFKSDIRPIELPLDAWIHGEHIHQTTGDEIPPSHWLVLDRGGKHLKIKQAPLEGKHEVITFQIDRQITHFQYSIDAAYPLLSMSTHISSSSRSPARQLTLKLYTKHPNWKDTEYMDMLRILEGQIKQNEKLDRHAAKSCWEVAQRSGELARRSVTSSSHARTSRRVDTHQQELSQLEHPLASPPKPRPKPKPAYAVKDHIALAPEPRRSARHSGPTRLPSPGPSPNSDEIILVYPPAGSGPGAINISYGDLRRLQPYEFLNDTMIEFGLKLWLNDLREQNPELANEVHVFSSFFYKKLNVKNQEDGYNSVRKWTAKFDLFQKKYLIIPINEHAHWYLAIIYHPEHVLVPSDGNDSAPIPSVTTRGRARQSDNITVEMREGSPMLTSDTGSPEAAPSVVGNTASSSHIPQPSSRLQSETVPDSEGEMEVEQALGSCSISDEKAMEYESRIHSDVKDMDCDALIEGQLMYPEEPTPAGDAIDPVEESYASDMLASKPLSLVKEQSVKASGLTGKDSSFDEKDASAVSAANFYGSVPVTRKPKMSRQPFPMEKLREDQKGASEDVDEAATMSDTSSKGAERSTTYIFTLDSLGSRHPHAIKLLNNYLRAEAKDKKKIEETSKAIGKQAFVPVQPNYCDCGLYLIHFVSVFMSDPARFCQLINQNRKRPSLQDRQLDWQDSIVASLREQLSSRITTMSETWKKEKTAKDEPKKDGAESTVDAEKTPTEVEDSDDDIIVQDIKKPTDPTSKRGHEVPGETIRVMRLRG